jgi:hypothetical protein
MPTYRDDLHFPNSSYSSQVAAKAVHRHPSTKRPYMALTSKEEAARTVCSFPWGEVKLFGGDAGVEGRDT